MPQHWKRHDDSTYFLELGGVLLLAVIYDRLGSPGWKVQVGKRTLRDKIPSQEDAQKVALAFANRILVQCRKELDALLTDTMGEGSSS